MFGIEKLPQELQGLVGSLGDEAQETIKVAAAIFDNLLQQNEKRIEVILNTALSRVLSAKIEVQFIEPQGPQAPTS